MIKLALLSLLASGFAAAPAEEPRTEWSGAQCLMEMPADEVVKGGRAWKKLWKEKLGKPAPEADFDKYFAVAVFLGERQTAGYSVVWDQAVEGKDMVLIRYGEKAPMGMSAMMLTRPWSVKLFPKVKKKEVLVEYDPR